MKHGKVSTNTAPTEINDRETQRGGVTLLMNDTADDGGVVDGPSVRLDKVTVLLNPYEKTPLTAIIKVTHDLLTPDEVRSATASSFTVYPSSDANWQPCLTGCGKSIRTRP